MLYEVPGGNMVDGLPPVASNATRDVEPTLGVKHIYGKAGLQT